MRASCLASILVVLATSFASAQALPPDLQKAVDARDAARISGDDQGWGRYTTDDFIVVFADGAVRTKAQRLAEIKGSKESNPKPKVSDMTFRTYGDTVIQTFREHTTSGVDHITQVWVKQSGQWRVAHVQLTRAAKP